MNTLSSQNCGNPPVHPIAWHSRYATKGIRLAEIAAETLGNLKHCYRQRRQRRIDRQAFQHMLTLDDATLKDIGITRSDVIWANSLPLSTNASAELEIVARQNRKRR